jgi:hypothetical protein
MDEKKALVLSDLLPEELEPRLELQVLVDPLGGFSDSSADNNCRDGGNCNIEQPKPPPTTVET